MYGKGSDLGNRSHIAVAHTAPGRLFPRPGEGSRRGGTADIEHPRVSLKAEIQPDSVFPGRLADRFPRPMNTTRSRCRCCGPPARFTARSRWCTLTPARTPGIPASGRPRPRRPHWRRPWRKPPGRTAFTRAPIPMRRPGLPASGPRSSRGRPAVPELAGKPSPRPGPRVAVDLFPGGTPRLAGGPGRGTSTCWPAPASTGRRGHLDARPARRASLTLTTRSRMTRAA